MDTRQGFLMQLKYNMACRFSRREIRDALEDFNGFFEEGIREGKTEEEICRSFGNPKELVRQMSSGRRRLPLRMFFALAASVAWLACIWGIAAPFHFQHIPSFFFCIPVLAAALALLFIEGGILLQMAVPLASPSHKAAPLRLCMLLAMGCLALFSAKGLQWMADAIPPSSVGSTARNICWIFLFIGAALFLSGAHSFFRGNPFSFGTTVQGMGIFCSACAIMDFLHRLDVLPLSALPALIPCGCGLLLSLFYDGMAIYARRSGKAA